MVAVAQTNLGEQMAGVGRVGFELAAQLGDVEAQVAGLGAVVGSPDLGEQLLGLHQRTGVAQEHGEDLPFGGRQVHRRFPAGQCCRLAAAGGLRRAVAGDAVGGQVNGVVPEGDPRRGLLGVVT